MFFESVEEIEEIASRLGTSIFVVPDSEEVKIKNALVLKPEEKTVITIDQVRETLRKLNTKQTNSQFVIIRPADKLNQEASNTLLKTLEEPGDKIHFVLITNQSSKLLPTILSRANLYIFRTNFDVRQISGDDEKKKALAKRLIAARPSELVDLAQEITSKKEQVRQYTLDILSLAIEMLYKSYFLTKKDVFMKKLPKFLTTYENIDKNGNIKLHLVADLC